MEKKDAPIETILGGIAALIVGILIVATTSSSISYSSYSTNGAGSVIGIIIILGGLVAAGSGVIRMMDQSGDYEEYEYRPAEDFSERLVDEEKPAPAPAPVPVLTKTETPVVKKLVYCPYCGTAQKEDYTSCESCGAGRKR